MYFHRLCKNADNNLEIMFFLNVGDYGNNNSLTIVYNLGKLYGDGRKPFVNVTMTNILTDR